MGSMSAIHYEHWEIGPSRQRLTGPQQVIAFAVRALVTAAAVWAAAQIVDGIAMDGFAAFLFAGAILGLLNAFVKPALVIGTLPFIVITLGVGLILINVLFLALTAWLAGQFDIAFHISGFWDAFWGAILISVISFLMSRVISPDRIAVAATQRR
jgi:putative membrane protein